MKKIFTTFVIVISLSSIYAQDNAVPDAYKKAFETHMKDTGQIDLMLRMMKEGVKEQAKTNPMVTPQVAEEIVTRAKEEFPQAIMSELLHVYYKRFSIKELEELTKFYKTPLGKKYLDATPKISKLTMDVGKGVALKIGMEAIQKFQK